VKLIFEMKNVYALLAAALGARECVFVCRAASRCMRLQRAAAATHTRTCEAPIYDLLSPILLQPAASNCKECAHSPA
jgi:hypothetical protein